MAPGAPKPDRQFRDGDWRRNGGLLGGIPQAERRARSRLRPVRGGEVGTIWAMKTKGRFARDWMAVRRRFEPHMTLLRDRKVIPPTDIDPIRWTVREFVLVHSL